MVRETLTRLIGPEDLRDLYETQLLSESQIAERLGTRQVYIGRLRKRYGISTISQAERASRRLPELTEVQRDLILGSLLGDGWMAATSVASARFQEGHCEAQAVYTDWKADQLEPFVSDRFWREKKVGQKVFKGRSFTTVSCPQFRPFYDLFYPGPQHKRRFPSNLHTLMTPLMLAIWYMDDGSLGKGSSGGHTPLIAFGLDGLSLKRALRALRALGLRPTVYGEGGNKGIWFMKQAKVFRDLIEPHVPACMAYKLPVESPRQKLDRNARRLTSEKARSLAEAGMTVAEIAQTYELGESTVRRRLRQTGWRGKPGPRGTRTTQDITEVLSAKYPPSLKWADQEKDTQDAWVRDVLQTLRQGSFPYPALPESRTAFDRFCADKARLDLSTRGISLCYPFFPNRYEARYGSRASAFDAWHEDKELVKAIRWQFKVGDPVVPHRVLRAITANCRTPSVFRPAVARFIYATYAQPGDTVYDPCMGFGGRLLGALAAGVRYIATDVAPATVQGNQDLAAWLGRASDVSLHCIPAEEFEVPDQVRLVFTSPPYFQQERYAGGKQSWEGYGTLEAWVEGFLRPMVQRGAEALVPGGYWVLNIADVSTRGVSLPLVFQARAVLRDAGLVEEATLEMPLSRLNRSKAMEPILVWRKPTG